MFIFSDGITNVSTAKQLDSSKVLILSKSYLKYPQFILHRCSVAYFSLGNVTEDTTLNFSTLSCPQLAVFARLTQSKTKLGPELTMQTRQTSNSDSSCLSFKCAGISGVYHFYSHVSFKQLMCRFYSKYWRKYVRFYIITQISLEKREAFIKAPFSSQKIENGQFSGSFREKNKKGKNLEKTQTD